MTPRHRPWRVLHLPLAAAAATSLWACGGDGSSRVPASGDPEADQRAEMRVGSSEDRGKKPEGTLYQRLGGRATIISLVDDLTARVIADPRVNFERVNVRPHWYTSKYKPWTPSPQSINQFKQHMAEFLTLAAGGPAEYTGRDIRAVHKGMYISNNEFDAMVGDIKTSMDRLNLPRREVRDLLAVIETTRKEIVEKQ